MINQISKHIKLSSMTEVLGGCPNSDTLSTDYMMGKMADYDDNEYIKDDKTVDDHTTVFARGDSGEIGILNHQIKGFFKEAALALRSQTGLSAPKSKIDNYLFIPERFIPLRRKDGTAITEIDGYSERPLRREIMGSAGCASALASSEMLNDWTLEFDVVLLDNKATYSKGASSLDWDMVETLLDYGQFKGLGQWRNSGKGQFTHRTI